MSSTPGEVSCKVTLGYHLQSIAITSLMMTVVFMNSIDVEVANRVFTPPTFHHAYQLTASFGSGRHKYEIPLQGTVRC